MVRDIKQFQPLVSPEEILQAKFENKSLRVETRFKKAFDYSRRNVWRRVVY